MSVAPNSRFGLNGTARLGQQQSLIGVQCPTGYAWLQGERAVPRGGRWRSNAGKHTWPLLGGLPGLQC